MATQTKRQNAFFDLQLLSNPAFELLQNRRIWCYAEIYYQDDGSKQMCYRNRAGAVIKADTRNPYTTGMNALTAMTNRERWMKAHRRKNALKPLPVYCLVVRLGNGVLGLDYDDCRDAKTKELTPGIHDLLEQLPTYQEISLSGTGVHGLMYAQIADTRGKTAPLPLPDGAGGTIEFLLNTHMLFTGNALNNLPIVSLQDEAQTLYEQVTGKYTGAALVPVCKPTGAVGTLTRKQEVLIACNQRSHDLFTLLYPTPSLYHTIPKYENDHSSADMALCAVIYGACREMGMDEATASLYTDALFRDSGLMRSKWDEKRGGNGETYGYITIRKVAASYKPVTPTAKIYRWLGDEEQKPTAKIYRYITHITQTKTKNVAVSLATLDRPELEQLAIDQQKHIEEQDERLQAYEIEDSIRALPGLSANDASILIAIRREVMRGTPNERGYTVVLETTIAAHAHVSDCTVRNCLVKAEKQELLERQKNAPRYDNGHNSLCIKLSPTLLYGYFPDETP